LAAILSPKAQGAVPTALTAAALRVARSGAADVPGQVNALMKGVVPSRHLSKLRWTAVVGILCTLVGLGMALLAHSGQAAGPSVARKVRPARAGRRDERKRPEALVKDLLRADLKQLRGLWGPLWVLATRTWAEDLPAANLAVTDGQMVLNPKTDRLAITYKLDPRARPKAIDLVPQAGPARGKTLRGIYSLDGEYLEICYNPNPGGKRPRAFVTTQDFKGAKLLVFKRTRPGAKPRPTELDQSRYHLKVIALALFNYHRQYGHFPPAALRDKNGKPLLSWRVLLLPFLEQDNLFQLVRQDQAWDSKANKLVSNAILKVYCSPRAAPGKFTRTCYQAFTGPKTAFANPKGARLADLTRRKSNPILVAEAGEAVPWAKPADLTYSAKQPLPRLGGQFKAGFHILLADGSVRIIKKGVKEKWLRRAITGRPEKGGDSGG
jgi:uncharacterized protein (TIGR03067 family)